ncbi:aldehyde dehydrogenase (NADP(+)) [Aureimonas fodinaquatilis]|uniref:Aldehyde dehydrogenase (NADP(+)) n=1 Tax=Aureimonas fodinaquatilis TaxID=2565783 RepID=A0A5B0DQ52_9HYPH|nr:aldehyde dehydrogenase (NADP(+)) [Aureimonas fodinaquatilis]KAA0968152.1 aldehyde dehydrogenase (NADP(+)) [Aureimonas fodinaquatilis]
MPITGENLIDGKAIHGTNGEVRAFNPNTGETLEPAFGGATQADLDRACALASEAFDDYRNRPLEERAAFLEAIADNIMALGDELVDRCVAESGLMRGRVEGERGRTVGQLRFFAQIVRKGDFLRVVKDAADEDRKPARKPELKARMVGLGPVAVFSASNFPLAFSIAGGDTASALAAGCPVIAKAHSAHLGTSELIGRAVQKAVADAGLPSGTFALLFDTGRKVGQGLVADSRIKAVGFTGSRGGGTAFMKIAQERAEPIPVYAEMSSINPVLLLQGALSERAEKIGAAFAQSVTLGAGQFCTNPGLLLAVAGDDLTRFEKSAAEELAKLPAQTMLTAGIHKSYEEGVSRLENHAAVTTLAHGQAGQNCQGQAALFTVSGQEFLSDPALHEEVFGAASLLVRCQNMAELQTILEKLEGQLTIAVHLADSDSESVRSLLPLMERRAGRLLVNGFGTGVEVSTAMVHGGPFPATSDGRSTSVGALAIDRFLRPVSYQDFPAALLPAELRDL